LPVYVEREQKVPLRRLKTGPRRAEDRSRSRLRLLVSTRNGKGAASPIRRAEVPLQIPPDESLYAMGRFYEYELTARSAASGSGRTKSGRGATRRW
jgi:hypothetical protein